MKYTKKMIMVPEAEYHTLLNMIKGDDYLKTEKAEIDTEISKILRDSKLNEGTKARKYNWLLKQRKNLQKEINKPQQVQIDPEQLKSLETDLSKYLGVEATNQQKPPQSKYKTNKRKKVAVKIRANKKGQKQQIPEEEEDEEGYETPPEEADIFNSPPQKSSSFSLHKQQKIPIEEERTSKQYILHPKHRSQYISIIKGKANQYKVNTKSGSILGENKQPIMNSNYKHVLDYLTGGREDEPPGTDALIERIEKEKWYKEALEWADYYRQRGEGKRRRHPPYIKHTKGLIRVKKTPLFKPIIWERI